MMIKEDVIIKTLRRIEDNQASMDRDMAKDRQDIQNLSVGYGEIKLELAELRRAINLQVERTRDKIAETIEPMIESSDRLTTQIKKSKKIFILEPKNWFKKILNI